MTQLSFLALVLLACCFLYSKPSTGLESFLRNAVDFDGSSTSGAEWSYGCTDSPNGPSHWGELSPEWSKCSQGGLQSPIDIKTYEAEDNAALGPLNFVYDNDPQYENASLVYDGHNVLVKRGGGSLVINGVNYSSIQVEVHSPSEHTFNGKHYPLELRVVHQSSAGDYASVTALLEYDKEDNVMFVQYFPFLKDLQQDKALHLPVMVWTPEYDNHHYYLYKGSLTTPPCSENVTWIVLKQIYTVSPQQVEVLTSFLKTPSNRPTQPLNGRKVFSYDDAFEATMSS
ncbi:hypothetical protein O6H91_12G063000 [Diphasiastrum complanatum]|uniref:Uncharacterized protein n=1 Tax=Diphasiastrum complanatum TaxID=34168 RepID=A0ACC2C2J0_DIPCM|nr:hypothetical protein O6H91_12G063000 [Diphasiastrum complanatum]